MNYRALVLTAVAAGIAFAAYVQPSAGVPPSAHQRSVDEMGKEIGTRGETRYTRILKVKGNRDLVHGNNL
jgi:hypothetical protein